MRGSTRAGRSATEALTEAIEPFRDQVAGAGGDLAQRVADIDDVRDRAIAISLGLPLPGLPDRGDPYVLVADDLAPADAALLDPAVVLAIVTVGGGPTGHTAILARELGIPAVVACPGASELATGQQVAVFATEGTVVVEPDAGAVWQPSRARRASAPADIGREPAGTADGHRVAMLANVGSPDRAAAARAAGAEGVGLLRTEFCFEGRGQAPTVAEQVAAYGQVARAFAGTRVVIRLLDAGADKPLPYVRSARRGQPGAGRARPARTARRRRRARRPARRDRRGRAAPATPRSGRWRRWWRPPTRRAGSPTPPAPPGIATAGVMIEIPSAALAAADAARPRSTSPASARTTWRSTRSPPTAASRALAALQSPWHPALLRLVEMAARGGRRDRATGRRVRRGGRRPGARRRARRARHLVAVDGGRIDRPRAAAGRPRHARRVPAPRPAGARSRLGGRRRATPVLAALAH